MEKTVKCKVRRWGNSLIITIPSHIVKTYDVVIGDEIEVVFSEQNPKHPEH